MSSVRTRVAAALALVAPLVIGSLLTPGCSSDDAPPGGGGDAGAVNAEPLFRAVEKELVGRCGGTNGVCHVNGTFQGAPRWLAGPDPYLTARRYRGILPATRDIGDSILLTQVDHVGPSLKRYPELFQRVSDWLVAEVPPPVLPNTGAFPVTSGFNRQDLQPVAPDLAGGAISFIATENNNILTLSAIKLTAPPTANVKVQAPFFVILPRSGKVNADPDVNGFKGELTVPAGTTATFFLGRMVLLRWDPAGQLKLVFEKIETTPGQGRSRDCTALDSFKTNAIPAMRTQIQYNNGDAGTASGSCAGCHTESGDEIARNAMDLTTLDTDPAAACAQARNFINFADKARSPLVLTPMGDVGGGAANHPVQTLKPTDPTIMGLQAWINDEKEQ